MEDIEKIKQLITEYENDEHMETHQVVDAIKKIAFKGKSLNSIGEVFIAEIYERDELYKICDWFAEEPNVIFGSVCGDACFRAEPDDIDKDKWCIKEYWRAE